MCQTLAELAGLDGNYRAWLSAKWIDAKDRVLHPSAGPYQLVDGSIIAADAAELLTTGPRVAAIIYFREHLRMVSPESKSEHEFEVTLEMVEAGVSALYEFDLLDVVEGWVSRGEVVRAVLGEAFRVAREGQRTTEASFEYRRISIPSALVGKFLI